MARRKVRLERPADCRFDERKADRAVRFFNEHLRHTKGRFYGQPFNLRSWQELDIREIFGRVDENGNRVIRQVYMQMGKKSGKSSMAAGVALKLLFADDERGGEIYGAAAERRQAGIVYQTAASMVKQNPRLLRMCASGKVNESTKRIVVPEWESYYEAISAEVAGKHGYNSHGVIFDEVHAQRDFRLWEVLTYGSGAARTQPLVFAISNAGVPGESPVAEMLYEEADQILRGVTPCPESFYPVIYGAEDDDPWDSEEIWRLCNPAYGDFLDPRSVREEFEKAQRRPAEQNSFRRFVLSQWTKQETRFIDMADWDRCNGPVNLEELRELPCWAGLDLSTKSDLTALVLVFLDGNGCYHLCPCFWLPEDNLTGKPNQEGAKYRVWHQQGFLNTTPGNVIDYAAVRACLNEWKNEVGLDIREVAFDPWNATQFAQQLKEDGFTPVEVPQNYRYLSEATKELQTAAMQGNLRHGGHPVLRWMADCMTVKQDVNGNVRPVKPNRLKNSKRIDGIVAGVMAISRAMLRSGEQRRSIYERRGIRFID